MSEDSIDRNPQHDEWLDELFPEITIGQLIYSPSETLYSVDPIAYRQSVLDWEDQEGKDND